MEARVGNTDVSAQPDGARFAENTVCDLPQSYVDTGTFEEDRVKFHRCGAPVNGKYVFLQTLAGGTKLGMSEVVVYVGMEQGTHQWS